VKGTKRKDEGDGCGGKKGEKRRRKKGNGKKMFFAMLTVMGRVRVHLCGLECD
jgi:hypothetical protein